jgi:hypothetical protein
VQASRENHSDQGEECTAGQHYLRSVDVVTIDVPLRFLLATVHPPPARLPILPRPATAVFIAPGHTELIVALPLFPTCPNREARVEIEHHVDKERKSDDNASQSTAQKAHEDGTL